MIIFVLCINKLYINLIFLQLIGSLYFLRKKQSKYFVQHMMVLYCKVSTNQWAVCLIIRYKIMVFNMPQFQTNGLMAHALRKCHFSKILIFWGDSIKGHNMTKIKTGPRNFFEYILYNFPFLWFLFSSSRFFAYSPPSRINASTPLPPSFP